LTGFSDEPFEERQRPTSRGIANLCKTQEAIFGEQPAVPMA
jgi:hypothetical protein